VCQRGYGTVFGEREPNVNVIAAPVLDRAGTLTAILGLQGPANHLQGPTRLLGQLREGTATLMRALGAGR
jgi:DNA-binding IclR family transcriptional regulator